MHVHQVLTIVATVSCAVLSQPVSLKIPDSWPPSTLKIPTDYPIIIGDGGPTWGPNAPQPFKDQCLRGTIPDDDQHGQDVCDYMKRTSDYFYAQCLFDVVQGKKDAEKCERFRWSLDME